MKKGIRSNMIMLAFACFTLVFMASCATTTTTVDEPATAAGDEEAARPTDVEPEEAPDKEAPAVTAKVEPTGPEELSEQEKQERLMELQRQQQLAEEIRKFESENIYFDFDKYDLKPPARANLREKAEWLRLNPEYSIRIEGHCDERGTNEYNLALGERRAHSAKRFLMALGISEDRIATISYGEERPAQLGHYETAWAKNRRDEFSLIK